MSKIFIIKEKNNPFYNERIVCSFTDEEVAKRFCRDMRTDGELYYETLDLNPCSMQDISAEKLYRVTYRIEWHYRKDIPEIEAYNDLMKEEPIALVDRENLLSIANGCQRAVQLESDYYGTSFSLWCYAKNAPAAISIMKRTLINFDPKILEWGTYLPMRKRSKKLIEELERRIKPYNEKKK